MSCSQLSCPKSHLENLTEFLERHPGRLRQRFALEAPKLIGDLLEPDSARRRQRNRRQCRVSERKVESEEYETFHSNDFGY